MSVSLPGLRARHLPAAPFLAAAALVALGSGCTHSESFGAHPSEIGLPPWMPNRMTYSAGTDVLAGHSGDGKEVFYTYCEDSKVGLSPPCGEPPPLPNGTRLPGDRCLGSLPSQGGGRLVAMCGSPEGDADSAKIFRSGTRLTDGSLVFAYSAHRVPAMTIPLEAKLYILRPGQQEWATLVEYPYLPNGGAIPFRVLSAGPGRVVTVSPIATELVTIASNNSVARESAPAFDGIDPATGAAIRVVDGMIRSIDLETGAEADLMPVPTSDLWPAASVVSASIGAGTVAIVQGSPGGSYRVMAMRSGESAVQVGGGEGQASLSSMAPDGHSVVVQVNGDLYRYAIP